jgi:hypothetical protein
VKQTNERIFLLHTVSDILYTLLLYGLSYNADSIETVYHRSDRVIYELEGSGRGLTEVLS